MLRRNRFFPKELIQYIRGLQAADIQSIQNMRGWRNWQTHYLEVVAPARAWRFESSPAHTHTYYITFRFFLMDCAKRSPLVLSHAARFARLQYEVGAEDFSERRFFGGEVVRFYDFVQ